MAAFALDYLAVHFDEVGDIKDVCVRCILLSKNNSTCCLLIDNTYLRTGYAYIRTSMQKPFVKYELVFICGLCWFFLLWPFGDAW